jgi:hypothetical protein
MENTLHQIRARVDEPKDMYLWNFAGFTRRRLCTTIVCYEPMCSATERLGLSLTLRSIILCVQVGHNALRNLMHDQLTGHEE